MAIENKFLVVEMSHKKFKVGLLLLYLWCRMPQQQPDIALPVQPIPRALLLVTQPPAAGTQ